MVSEYTEAKNYLDYTRDQLINTIELIASQPEQEGYGKYLSKYRNIDYKYISDARIFYALDKMYIRELVDDTLLDLLGFSYNDDNIFRERFVIPIPDMYRRYVGMAGYDADSDTKYLFSRTAYFNKIHWFYNMDKLPNIYREGYVILTEGFFDSIALNSIGLQNNLATMGTSLYDSHYSMLSHIPLKILLPDSDESGTKAATWWQRKLGRTAYIRIKDKDTKDIDAVLNKNPAKETELRKLINKIIEDNKSPFFRNEVYYI